MAAPLAAKRCRVGRACICFATKACHGLAKRKAFRQQPFKARLAQSVERKALNLVVVGSSPTVGVFHEAAVEINTLDQGAIPKAPGATLSTTPAVRSPRRVNGC